MTVSNAQISLLLVDDEPDIVSVFSRALKQAGLTVHSFSDPIAGLSFFTSRGQDIDLLISDIRMPKMSRFELARHIKEIRPEVKVLLMTSMEIGSFDQDEKSSMIVNEFLQKPMEPKNLTAIVMKHIKIFDEI